MNIWGRQRIPFLFVFDFLCKTPLVFKLDEIIPDELMYSLNGFTNSQPPPLAKKQLSFEFNAVSKAVYSEAFETVQYHIGRGDSFLLNLTMPSKVKSSFGLKEIFFASKAKYKLWLKDKFVVFSPEIFVKTKDGKISSFPMKGTIDAALPNAESLLLSSKKELAEHFTIVDLIRNDLSLVSKNVKVEKFRSIEKLKTNRGELLQMSSEISGELADNWQENIGSLLSRMLPAGSISGAPKTKTLDIIANTEDYDRGFYTGVFGIFDGHEIDSGVMIRFVEKQGSQLVYKSGGGITAKSVMEEEYEELRSKVYIPV